MWPTSASRPSEISAVALAMPTRRGPKRRARLRQAIALLQGRALHSATGRQQAERGVADRAAHPELVPCPRAVAAEPLAARHRPNAVIGDRDRARRAGRVAAAEHDAEAALVGGEPARKARDPALASSRAAAKARVDRRTASRRPPRDRTGRRARRAPPPARASRRRGNGRPTTIVSVFTTRSCRAIGRQEGVVALQPAGAGESPWPAARSSGRSARTHRSAGGAISATARARSRVPGAPRDRAPSSRRSTRAGRRRHARSRHIR